MKKSYIILIMVIAGFGISNSCKQSFLNVPPAGSLDQTLMQTPEGLDALLVGAYSMIDGVTGNVSTVNGFWETTASNWLFGSVRAMEAMKGSDAGDQPDANSIQTFSEDATNSYLNDSWRMLYESVSRCNQLILLTGKTLTAGKITQDQADLYVRQARVLRGWFHFEAWRMWRDIPYVDETTDLKNVSNDADVTAKIIDDLTQGTTLPPNMEAIGKFNSTVSKVLLAKALMQMKKDYAGALPLLTDVVATGVKPNGDSIGLDPAYGPIFDIQNRNDLEAVYTVQYSVNDGSGANNSSAGEVLNFPYKGGASPGGCCGFFVPTQEFVNSFRTAGGLPLFNHAYNATPVKNDYGLAANKTVNADNLAFTDPGFVPDAGPLDPRLDWTVGRRGIPFWDWGLHTGQDWIRDITTSAPYTAKKAVYQKSQEGNLTDISSWTPGYTANGYRLIRYADVLLLLAECQIETGNLAGALVNINSVRARAANPAGWVKAIDATGKPTSAPAANYVITTYPTLGNPGKCPADTSDGKET
jgi:hypothetical protein